ncbi:hypothetical protein BU15DRAFT_49272 [Melanogaster broomeanus]|nr:hypothetical protein BU15DRAFT_49272 [Melanogaster broomeanus]
MSLRTDRVRITVSFKRKEGISKEEFENFWLNEYFKLFNSLDIVKSNILKYEQAHANEVINKAIAEVGLPVAPFDAQATIEAATFEALMAVFTSEEYRTGRRCPVRQVLREGRTDVRFQLCNHH